MIFKNVCSLGNLCHSSYLLKEIKLKKESYPFDWVFSNFDIIIDCIKNNFKEFLDKDYYIKLDDINKCGHKKYCNSFFNHRNPLINEQDYEYYKRTVDRFNKLLKSTETKFFLAINVNIDNLDYNKELEKIIIFNEEFKKYTNNYKLVYIVNVVTNKENYYEINKINENIDIIIFFSKSKSDGLEFIDKQDNKIMNTLIKDNYIFTS